mgnify:FL=1
MLFRSSPEQASAEGRAAADRSVKGASAAAWTVFGAVAVALILNALGGALGAMGARRTPWNENMEVTKAAAAQTGMGHT